MTHKYEISYGSDYPGSGYIVTVLDLETYEVYQSQSRNLNIQSVIYYTLNTVGLLEIGNSLYFTHCISKIYTFVPVVSNNYKLSPKLSKLLMETLSSKCLNINSISEISETPDLLEGL